MEYAVHDTTTGKLTDVNDTTTYYTDDPSDAVDTLALLATNHAPEDRRWVIYTSAELGDPWKCHPQLTQLAYDRINLQEA